MKLGIAVVKMIRQLENMQLLPMQLYCRFAIVADATVVIYFALVADAANGLITFVT